MQARQGTTLMEAEAREAPRIAARLVEEAGPLLSDLGARLRKLSPRYGLAAGRGSSDAAALLAKYILEQQIGLPVVSVAPSLRSVYGRRLSVQDCMLLAISQSGRSPDLVEFAESLAGRNVMRIGLVNDIHSPLAEAVDWRLPLLAGQETSVAATKSCLAAMMLVFGLAAYWREDQAQIDAFARAPEALLRALAQDWSAGERFLAGDGPVYVIGRGPGLAIAAEAALKLKETNGLHAEAISAAEVRHGPLALAGPELRVIVFAQRDAAFEGLAAAADDLKARGCPVLVISPEPRVSDAPMDPDAEPVLELLGMLLRFYLLANNSALRRGRSPDAPPQLTKITKTR